MNSKIMLDQLSEPKKNSRLKKRRGVTENISTMLLMGITITGATTLTYFVNDAFVNGNLASASTLSSSSTNIFLLAYDTRDSSSLLTLSNVDNVSTGFLCRVTCNVAPVMVIPINSIVLIISVTPRLFFNREFFFFSDIGFDIILDFIFILCVKGTSNSSKEIASCCGQ